MSHETPSFTVVGGGARKTATNLSITDSPNPPPLIKLTAAERDVWKYICDALKTAGLEHITAGLPIAVIVRTYSAWLDSLAECADKGRHQVSGNGWAAETPWAADERRLKAELSQWLPKACLTIPSLTRVRKETGVAVGQDDLFQSMTEHVSNRPVVALKE